MKRIEYCCALSVLLLAVISFGWNASPAPDSLTLHPMIPAGGSGYSPTANVLKSYNWSGYAVAAANNSVSDIQANWIVPKAHCSSGNTYASIWVGIDGLNSNSVEQTGTGTDCKGSTAKYYAWYEMYPAASIKINNMPVHKGDSMHAEVKYLGSSQYTLTITNQTTVQTFQITLGGNDKRSSAEWIVEAPSLCNSHSCAIQPLTNFSTATMTNSTATIGSTTGSISAFASKKLNMVTPGNVVKASTGGLSAGGTTFTVKWHHK